jgi:hypothetical protein
MVAMTWKNGHDDLLLEKGHVMLYRLFLKLMMKIKMKTTMMNYCDDQWMKLSPGLHVKMKNDDQLHDVYVNVNET